MSIYDEQKKSFLQAHAKAAAATLQAERETDELFAPSGGHAPQPPDGLVTVCMDTVRASPVQWAWENRIPLQALSVLAGDAGLGKSTLTLHFAAQWSRGQAAGALQGTPTNVLIASAEDSAETTLKPRLRVTNADMSRIHIVQMRKSGVLGGITLPDDIEAVTSRMEELEARILIIDPLFAHLSGKVNSFKDQDLRRALAPLAQMAEQFKSAVIAVLHLNKDEQKDILGRISGSMATVAAARSVLLAAPDVYDPDDPTRFLGHIKCNVGRLAVTLAYHIEERHLSIDGQAIPTSALVWEAERPEVKARDLLARTERVDRNKREEATEWLSEYLRESPQPAEDIYATGKKLGFSESTLDRAKKDRRIKSQKHNFNGKWVWALPPEEPHTSEADTLRHANETNLRDNGEFYEGPHQEERDTLREDTDTLRVETLKPYEIGDISRFRKGGATDH